MSIRSSTVLLAVLCTALPAGSGEPAGQDKLRVFVDKVLARSNDHETREWMVAEAAQAGFNVFVPRFATDGAMERVAGWSRTHGIDSLVWMRATIPAPPTNEAEGKRLLMASGRELPLWSPNTDEFWTELNRRVDRAAALASKNPHMLGIFFDFEIYVPEKEGNGYELSYDLEILERFLRSRQREVPQIAPSERREWLQDQLLHVAFERFQVASWREACRKLRKRVDELDPGFQFFVYPSVETRFIREAVYPELATERAPLVLADGITMGRPSLFIGHEDALAENRTRLLQRRAIPQEHSIPFRYLGAVDPVSKRSDPEFLGKNAVMISEAVDGYWAFYEGPEYGTPEHAEYWRWLRWANEAIKAGAFERRFEPRETPEEWKLAGLDKLRKLLKAVPSGGGSDMVEFPRVRLRGENLVMISGQAGVPVAVELRNLPIASYRCILAWDLRSPELTPVASGAIQHGTSGMVRFTPVHTGSYALAVSSGSCAYSVLRSNAPLAFDARGRISLFADAAKLYFHVPRTTKSFSVKATGWRNETVKVRLYDPDGTLVTTGETRPDRETVWLRAHPQAGGDMEPWLLTIEPAEQGNFEDHSISLIGDVPGLLSLMPDQVFH